MNPSPTEYAGIFKLCDELDFEDEENYDLSCRNM